MVDVPAAWLKSGEYAHIAGHRLRPLENQFLKGMPLIVARGQAQALFLTDDNNLDWILKKFLPGRHPGSNYIRSIAELIPHSPGFQSGYLRRILSKEDISRVGLFSESFASWFDDTVLMPRIKIADWAIVADRIRSGTLVLPNDERILLCRRLSEQVNLLERSAISHRNLSCTNTFIDERTLSIHLIDWDEIFHPTLAMPHNASFGSCGYIAPFVYTSGYPHAWISWRPQADRFSLAILNSEFLVMRPDSSLHGDGGIFNQDELCARSGEGIDQILDRLRKNFPGAEVLLKRALDARGFDDCPSPAEWLAFSTGVDVSFVNSGESLPPARFDSCFISYSHKDSEFAQRLHSRLRDAGLRVWFAPEDVTPGVKMIEQVDEAIEKHDRLLLVLSEHSLQSKWVREEIRRTRKFERQTGRCKLFPIRITGYETLQQWSCMDTVTMEDLADEIRSYFIPDFSNWKNYDDFESAFERLLNALKPRV